MSNCGALHQTQHRLSSIPWVILLTCETKYSCRSVHATRNPSAEKRGYIPFTLGSRFSYGNFKTVCNDRFCRDVVVLRHCPIRNEAARDVHMFLTRQCERWMKWRPFAWTFRTNSRSSVKIWIRKTRNIYRNYLKVVNIRISAGSFRSVGWQYTQSVPWKSRTIVSRAIYQFKRSRWGPEEILYEVESITWESIGYGSTLLTRVWH